MINDDCEFTNEGRRAFLQADVDNFLAIAVKLNVKDAVSEEA
ncbi:MAG: hypothetical protein ABJF67_04705 [Aurantimonas coralicida]